MTIQITFSGLKCLSVFTGIAVLMSQQDVHAQNVATEFLENGISGGGRLLSMTVSPFNSADAFAVCDMMGVYKTNKEGLSWRLIPSDAFAGSARTRVQYAGNSSNQRIYGIKRKVWGSTKNRPAMSLDGGETWVDLKEPTDPSEPDQYYSMVVDPSSTSASTQRIVTDNYTKLWFSGTGGEKWNLIHQRSGSEPESVRLAGVAWDGATIYVGTNVGLFRSVDGGVRWAPYSLPGLPSDSQIVEFTGAKAGRNGAITLFAIVMNGPAVEGWNDVFDLENSNEEGDREYLGLYSVRPTSQSPRWVARPGPGGIPFAKIDVPATNSSRPWASTSRNIPNGQGGGVYKGVLSNSNLTWNRSLESGSPDGVSNSGVSTGFHGDGGLLSWDWSPPCLALDVSDSDPNRVLASGSFPYMTDNGGNDWMQMYVNPATENPAGTEIQFPKSYLHSGLSLTTGHWVLWANSDVILGAGTDLGLQRSEDGGVSWTNDYTPTNSNGLDESNWYALVKKPNSSRIYAGLANINDFYETDRLGPESDGEDVTGDVRYSDDAGKTWISIGSGVEDTANLNGDKRGRFPGPIVWLAVDPANPSHLYASSASSMKSGSTYLGGVYRTVNGGTSWKKLANPPGTQGRPLSVHVIGPNELVATFCARIDENGQFTPSSGVFYSNNGGSSWESRSDPGMLYYSRDLVVDPVDPKRWFVAVQSRKTNSSTTVSTFEGFGGVYRTEDKGRTWQKIFTKTEVTINGVRQPVNDWTQSVTYVPGPTPLLYATTAITGLWVSINPNDATPTFSRVTGFPFARARRVFVDPRRSDGTIWVTTQGGGLWSGTVKSSLGSSIVKNGDDFEFRVDVQEPSVTDISLFGIVRLPTPGSELTWADLQLTPTISTPSQGGIRYSWSGVQEHPLFAGSNGGFVRASRVRPDGTNETGQAGGFAKDDVLTGQTESWGIPFLKPVLHRSVAVSLGGTIRLEDPYTDKFSSGKQYYVEIEEGAYAGHRFELREKKSFTGQIWIIDLPNKLNTASELPALNGERVSLREHWTLAEAFPTKQFLGSRGAATSDAIQAWEGQSFVEYWLFRSGSTERWVKSGDSTLSNQGERLVPPGEGFLVRAKAAGVPRTLVGVGMVRDRVFRQPLEAGTQLVSLGFPVEATFSSNALLSSDGFVGTNAPATSDRVSVWRGDSIGGATGWIGGNYWLFAPGGSSPAWWALEGDGSLTNRTSTVSFPRERCLLIRSTTNKPARAVPLPWVP